MLTAWPGPRQPGPQVMHDVRRTRNLPEPLIFGLVALIVVAAIFSFAILLPKVISAGLRGSYPYRAAVEATRGSGTAVSLVGESLEFGEAAGTVTGLPILGFAKLTIPVKGTSNSGVVHVQARFGVLRWKLTRCDLDVPGSAPIDLLVSPSN